MGVTTIQGTTISGNQAGRGSDALTTAFTRDAGAGGNGGGVAVAGSLSITNSVITSNFAGAGGLSANGSSGAGGSGGGVHFTSVAGALTIDSTTISSNTAGHGVSGGGSGRVSSDGGDGGGVWSNGPAAIANSTISGNSAGNGGAARVASPIVNHAGDGGDGGGLWLVGAGIKGFVNTTVSGNGSGRGGTSAAGAASGDGGNGAGIWIGGTGAVTIGHSTIVNNIAGEAGVDVAGGLGGGLHGTGGGAYHAGTASSVQVNNSIVAQNVRGLSAPGESNDLAGPGSFAVRYSLIGVNSGATIANNGGNKIGAAGSPMNPGIGELADNGGVTFTHALDLTSPAANAGDPALVAGAGGTPANDQRGAPFNRVVGGRVDMGSIELEDAPTPADTDFDNDGDTDGNDFLMWQRGNGDANGDGDSDGDDLSQWRQNFGSTLVASSATVFVAASEAYLTAAAEEALAAETAERSSLDMLTGVGGYAIEQRGREAQVVRPAVSAEALPKAIGLGHAADHQGESAAPAAGKLPRFGRTVEVDSLDAAFEEIARGFGRHGLGRG
jgi:hypothetical protein